MSDGALRHELTSPTDLEYLYRALLLPRLIEHKMLSLLRRGELSKWFSGIGQEAVSVGIVSGLRDDDWILPGHRNLGVFCGRHLDLGRLFRQLLGRDGGYTRGRDRTFHFGALDHHIVGMISHLGAMLPVADGLALASQLRGEDSVAVAIVGDGATSEGDVHEAMNLAAVWKLPVIFVIENNQWGLSTPASQQYACAELVDRAAGYGMPGERLDGNDVLLVRDAVRRSAAYARSGHGPTLLECVTYRMRGHEEASGTDYVPPEDLDFWAQRDPLARVEEELDDRGWLDAEARDAIRDSMQVHIDEHVAAALQAPLPSSDATTELTDVFAPARPLARANGVGPEAGATSGNGTEARYLDAVTDGLRVALRADERVVLLGQDIAEYGGVFKVTAGLLEEFGPDRVRNTPIIESGALGAAMGLALDDFHPIIELQFGDFASCGFNQLVNNLATTHYRWGAPVPVVVRAPVGGGLGSGPFHSQNIESYFDGVPGLKVVAPATPADAKGLLLAALDDGNPVLYLEHKWLYRNAKGPLPSGHHTVPIGVAEIVRPGRDATVVAYGVGVRWALDAAAELANSGEADVEVVDLRSLRPWDREAVLDSVRRTSRVLVVHEAPLTAGFGAEVAATIADAAFEYLDAPVRRLGGLETPIPFARELEAIWSPQDKVLPALRDLLAF
ncbi:MAG TPA: dehydrogenase E1 component subunit alpha/beta [Acidimicrobiales bacterium]|jgi:2-oxoisovalerate dehydrogenase E1 component